jgi:hypothetical protein
MAKKTFFLFFTLFPTCFLACLDAPSPKGSVPSPESTVTRVTTEPTLLGARAAKIIFKVTPVFQTPSGSFDPAPASGTAATPGGGLQAARVFYPDGSLLAQGTNSSQWPRWLRSVEIGISGANNASAKNPACARFTDFSESDSLCTLNNKNFNCSGPAPFFRVSEYDCQRNNDTLNGNGSSQDGVSIRAYFNRDTSVLGAKENILAVLEYTAASMNPAPQNPMDCWSDGKFSPSNPGCSDSVWQIYLKHQSNEQIQPYLLLIPPTFRGSQISTKQFLLPLASDPNLTLVQISRISGLRENENETKFKTACNGSSPQANSPLCVGIIMHSLTFFRI